MSNSTDPNVNVAITATTDDLESGMHHATEEVESGAEQMKEAFEGVKETFELFAELVGVGLTLDWVKEAVAQVVELDVAAQHLSDAFGLSLGTLSDLNAAAMQADQGLEGAAMAMTRLERASAEAQAGSAQFVEAFRAVGITINDLKEMQPSELLSKVAESIGEMEPSAARTANMVQLFGRNIAGILPILKNLIEDAHLSAVAFGAVITDEATTKAEIFSKSMADVHLAAQGLGQEFVTHVLPALSQMAQQIAAMIANSQGLRDAIDATGTAMQFLADHLDGVVETGKVLIELALDAKIAGWSQAMYGAAIAAEGTQLAMLSIGTAATAAVGVGLAAFEGWKLGEWARENFSWVAEIGQWIAAAAVTIQKTIELPFELAFEAIKTAAESAIAYIRQIISEGFQKIASAMMDSWNPAVAQFGASMQGLADYIKPAQSAMDVWNQGVQQMGTTLKSAASSVMDIWTNIGADSKAAADGVDAMNAFRDAVKNVYTEMSHGHLTAQQVEADQEKLADLADGAVAGGMRESEVTKMLNQSYAALGLSLEETATRHDTYNAKVKTATDNEVALAAGLAKWQEENDKLLANQDPVTKALMGFDNEMLKSTQELIVLIAKGLDYNTALSMLMNRADEATAAEQRAVSVAYAKADVLDTLVQKYMDQDAAASAYTNAAKAQVEVDQAINKEIASLTEQYGADNDFVKANTAYMLANRDAAIANLTAFKDHTESVKQDETVMKEWATIAQNAFDSAFKAINKDIIEGGSIMTDLVNVAKQVVEEILLQFEKLAIINPILNSIFGGQGGFSLLPTLANSALGGLGGGNSLLSGAGNLLGIGNSGSGLLGNLFGNSFISDLLGSTGGTGSGLMGLLFGGQGGYDMLAGLSGVGDVGDLATAGLGLDSGLGLTGPTSGLLGSGGSVLGGLGGLASILGGATLGNQLGGPLGALGLGALSYAIPVVGWVAGAASLINSLTGGDLFGTGPQPTGVSFQGLNFNQGGFQYNDAIQTHSHGAFFSGGSWGQQSEPITSGQQTAQDQMTVAIQSTLASAASALGTKVGQLITGTFNEQLSSTGAVSSNLSTVLGKTFTDTIQQFATRITADNLLALLPAAQNAQAIAQQWQSSADTLLAGTQMLIQAQVDINKGMSLLGSDSSLADITKVVQQLTTSGETLLQTYARLQTEQADLKANLDELGLTTGKTGSDFLVFADQLTKAAGGISQLNSAWATYYSEYYTQAEQQANTMKQLQDTVNTTFAAIGESTKVSMQQFRADFTTAMPTLTPDQVVQWLAAGDALAKLTAANQQLANAAQQAAAAQAAAAAAQQAAQAVAKQQYDTFIDQFDPNTVNATSFEASLTKLDTTLQSNITQANTLARAAGMAGASQQDLANIIQASALQGVAALKAFEAQTQQLAQTLYGTNVQQLTTQLSDLEAKRQAAITNGNFGMELYYEKQEAGLQTQIDAANKQAQAMQRLSDASTLLQDLGQIGAVTGDSLSTLAKQMSIPLDQFAKDLGLSPDQLNQQYKQIELQAQAAIQANTYLSEILNVLQGKEAYTPANPHIPIHGGGIGPGGRDAQAETISAINNLGSKIDTMTSTVAQQMNPLQDISRTNRQIAETSMRSTLNTPIGNRNSRPLPRYADALTS